MKNVKILAIESSCDETSVAIVENSSKVLSLSIATQMDIHALYGGVVPEIASRMHTEAINYVIDDALNKAQLTLNDVDAIAVTYAPGLLGSLIVGVEAAKALSLTTSKPLIAVNHLMGHIFANNIDNELNYPLLALVVSGGHTETILMNSPYDLEVLGRTEDDAIGEAYDKVARVIGLDYPGGPNVEKYALKGQPTYKLPQPMNNDSLNFSFSGLKSAIVNLAYQEKIHNRPLNKENLARSFQDIAVKEICQKVSLALQKTQAKYLIVAGGVSANKYLREELINLAKSRNIDISIPKFIYCTDNAAMIGAAAYYKYLKQDFADYSLNPTSIEE